MLLWLCSSGDVVAKADFECGRCGFEPSGYTKAELAADGWRFFTVSKAQSFPLCGGCVKVFEPIWEARKALSSA